jgi:hypothetical protein
VRYINNDIYAFTVEPLADDANRNVGPLLMIGREDFDVPIPISWAKINERLSHTGNAGKPRHVTGHS